MPAKDAVPKEHRGTGKRHHTEHVGELVDGRKEREVVDRAQPGPLRGEDGRNDRVGRGTRAGDHGDCQEGGSEEQHLRRPDGSVVRAENFEELLGAEG